MTVSRPVTVMLALFVAAAIWGAAFELTTSTSLRSFRVHSDDSLFGLVQSEQAGLKKGFDIYLLLREVGGDRTVVAPPGYLFADRLDGLSDMTLEVDSSGGPSPTDDDVERLLSLPGLDGAFDLGDPPIERSLHIVLPDDSEERLRLILTDTRAIVVGESTLDSMLADG